MEVEDVEARVIEMMETDDTNYKMTDDAPSNQQGKHENSDVEMTINAASNYEMTDDASSDQLGKRILWDAITIPKQQQGEHKNSNVEMTIKAASNQLEGQVVLDLEKLEMFSNIGLMISRWEAQEAEEDTPIVEMVRKSRRSKKLEETVVKFNLESEVTSDLQNTSSVEEKTTLNQINNKLLYPSWYPDSYIAPK